MKRLLIALLFLSSALLQAQTVTTALYQVDASGNNLAGALVLPADYATTTDSLQLFVFNHGTGQAGDGTLATIGTVAAASGVFANGSALYQGASISTPFTAVSPVTGKAYRFAMFGLQGLISSNPWCAQAAQVDYVIKNTLLPKYRLLPGIAISGLSAGAETSWEAIAGPNAALYSCGIPMSTPAIYTGICNFNGPAVNRTKVWAFHGISDIGVTSYYNSVTAIGYLDAVIKGLTRLTSFSGGHCCWPTYFNPGYRENITYYYKGTKQVKSMNVYEFALASMPANNITFDTTSSIAIIPIASITKAIPILTVSGTSVIADGSTSTGNGGVSAWQWDVTDTTGKAIKVTWDNYINYGGGQPVLKTASGLANGKYIFNLTVWDKYGGFNVAGATAIVGTVVTPPPAPKVVSQCFVYKDPVSGLIVVTVLWSDGTTTVLQ